MNPHERTLTTPSRWRVCHSTTSAYRKKASQKPTCLLVRGRGLEPPRINHTHLKRARLPVPPPSHTCYTVLRFLRWCGLLGYSNIFPAIRQVVSLFLISFFMLHIYNSSAARAKAALRAIAQVICTRKVCLRRCAQSKGGVCI